MIPDVTEESTEPKAELLATPYISHGQLEALANAGLTAAEMLGVVVYATSADNQTGICKMAQRVVAARANIDRGVLSRGLAKAKAAGLIRSVEGETSNYTKHRAAHLDLTVLVSIRGPSNGNWAKARERRTPVPADLKRFVDKVIGMTAVVEECEVTPRLRAARTTLLSKIPAEQRGLLLDDLKWRVQYAVKRGKTMMVYGWLRRWNPRYSEKVRKKLLALEKSRVSRGEPPSKTWWTEPGRVAWAVKNAIKESQPVDDEESPPATPPARNLPETPSQVDSQIEGDLKPLGVEKDFRGDDISAGNPTTCKDAQIRSGIPAHNLRSIGV
jgi:DNA-binding Lrp family transcriptional regulator